MHSRLTRYAIIGTLFMRAQDDLSIAAMSIGDDAIALSATLDLEPHRYERGHTMARRLCRFLRALAKCGLACSLQVSARGST